MKAIVCNQYGTPDVLELKEVSKPRSRENEVLVRIFASSLNFNIRLIVSGRPLLGRLLTGIIKPTIKIPGNDIAGKVAEVGKNVTQFKKGDEVYADTSHCGFGAFAEYVSVPEKMIARKPTNLSFEEAASIPEAALVALHGLRDKGKIRASQKVLIYGASGGIGTFAVQIAKYYGAEVTGVCSTKNQEIVGDIGADHVIDYNSKDYNKTGERYDLIFGIAYRSIYDHLRALSYCGKYVSVGGPSFKRMYQDMFVKPKEDGKKSIGGWSVKPSQKDLEFLSELVEAGKVKPVIDRSYALEKAAEAIQYYEQGLHHGKVVISI